VLANESEEETQKGIAFGHVFDESNQLFRKVKAKKHSGSTISALNTNTNIECYEFFL
jgi:hypothetical protein